MDISAGVGALGGAAIGAAGSLAGSALNYASAQDAMKFSERSYKHRYQWTMADMRKAGLNPIFAYKGIGTGSPAGVSANFNNPLSGAATGAKAGYDIATAKEQFDLLKNQRYKTDREAELANSMDALKIQEAEHNQLLYPILRQQAQASANSAASAESANKSIYELQKKIADFYLRNPNLFKTGEVIKQIAPAGNMLKGILLKGVK